MSNAGQAFLTVTGFIVGAYFGYPQLGLMLGSLAGSRHDLPEHGDLPPAALRRRTRRRALPTARARAQQ